MSLQSIIFGSDGSEAGTKGPFPSRSQNVIDHEGLGESSVGTRQIILD